MCFYLSNHVYLFSRANQAAMYDYRHIILYNIDINISFVCKYMWIIYNCDNMCLSTDIYICIKLDIHIHTHTVCMCIHAYIYRYSIYVYACIHT